MQRSRSIVPSAAAGLVLAICLSASNAAGFCRGVTSTPPAGYDPSVSGCYGTQAGSGFLDLYWTNLCVGYSVDRAASSQVTLAQATAVADQAFGAWSHVTCSGGGSPSVTPVDEGPVDCASIGYDEHGANQHVITFRDDGWPYSDSSNTLGLTTITYDTTTGEIVDADIEINSHDFALVVGAPIPAGAYDLGTVITHEAGHLGLAHSDQTSAVMYAHYLPGAGTGGPSPDDVAGICAIDVPGGTRSTSAGSTTAAACDATPRNGFSTQCGASADAGAASTVTGATPAAPTGATCSVGARLGHGTALGSCILGLLVLGLLGARRRARRSHAATSAVGVAIYAALTVGCAGDDTNPGPPSDAGAAPPTVDATVGGPDAEVPVTVAIVRVANWSEGAPAVDFCLAPHGSTAFRGPLLAGAAGDAGVDAGAASLPFPEVSAYLFLAPGQYDARVVVAGANDCSIGIGADTTTLPALGRDQFATIALVGDVHSALGAGLQLVGFADDGTGSEAGVALRFINASTATAGADLGTGTLAATFKPLFVDVGFAHASASSNAPPDASTKIDGNGYAAIKALSLSTLSAHALGATTDTAVALNVSAAPGSVVTMVLIGPDPSAPAEDGGATAAPRLLECVDNAGTLGLLGSCVVVSE